jgi:hypothetical protein
MSLRAFEAPVPSVMRRDPGEWRTIIASAASSRVDRIDRLHVTIGRIAQDLLDRLIPIWARGQFL